MPTKAIRKSRTAMSCDRCKNRKTKCSNPSPGPCDYCRSIGAMCKIDVGKRRQRPYYSVSQEEFRHMQTILRHYLPEAELTLPTLRSIASRCDEDRNRESTMTPEASAPPSRMEMAPSHHQNEGDATVSGQEDVVLEEVVNLQKDLGCLLADARGEYRYVGAESGISFNSAVRVFKTTSPQEAKDPNIIPGLESVTMPVPSSKSGISDQEAHSIPLPAKEIALQCASRFFEQVHCIHWLYSSEQFHSRLQATYSHQRHALSSSWLCSLYCMFALGSIGTSLLDDSQQQPKSSEYLEMAKSMVTSVCDEADLDSVRAMILLSLAMQSYAFSNSAYLYTGMAIRIAFSLGLHLDKYFSSDDMVQKEHARRIWWSLDVVDQETAFRVGKPCMAGPPAGGAWQSPLPSEQILNTGPYTPPGYLALSVSLSQLSKSARNVLYIEPVMSGKPPSIKNVGATLSSLREWLAGVPPYLCPSAPVAPFHKRPIALLHVRYWNSVILSSRPFLLCNLWYRSKLQHSRQLRFFEEMSSVCVNAAEQVLTILLHMKDEDLLSSILVADFYYTLDAVQVFLIAHALGIHGRHVEHVRSSLEVLQSMATSPGGHCQKMLPEVLNQLRDWDVLSGLSDSQQLDTATASMAMQQGSDLYETLFGTTESLDIDVADMFLTDAHLFNTSETDAFMQEIMGMTHEMMPMTASS